MIVQDRQPANQRFAAERTPVVGREIEQGIRKRITGRPRGLSRLLGRNRLRQRLYGQGGRPFTA
jgi:hypothetical protein